MGPLSQVQIAYGCITLGLPDHAGPRRVMVKDLTLSTFPITQSHGSARVL